MENKNNFKNSNSKRAFINPTGYTIKNEYVTIFLGDQLALRVHENYFKKIVGKDFIPVSQEKSKKEVA